MWIDRFEDIMTGWTLGIWTALLLGWAMELKERRGLRNHIAQERRRKSQRQRTTAFVPDGTFGLRFMQARAGNTTGWRKIQL